MAAFDVRKQEVVGREVNKLKEATNLLNELLSSMNLPAALEDTTGGGVPASLQEKSQAIIQVIYSCFYPFPSKIWLLTIHGEKKTE